MKFPTGMSISSIKLKIVKEGRLHYGAAITVTGSCKVKDGLDGCI